MRPIAFAIAFSLLTPFSATAAPERAPLRASAEREGMRLGASPALPQSEIRQDQRASWISRHPALFGTLVGAGAGTVMSLTMENEMFCSRGDEDCFFHGGSRALVGAAMGAGVGALVGWIAGSARGDRAVRTTPDRSPGLTPDPKVRRTRA